MANTVLAILEDAQSKKALGDLTVYMLEKAESGCEPLVLARLMGLSEAVMTEITADLVAEGRLVADEFGCWRIERSPRQHAARKADLLRPCLVGLPPLSSLAAAFQNYLEGRYIDALRLNLNVLKNFVSLEYSLTARRAYDIISRQLLDLRVPLEDRELCSAMLYFGLQIQGEMQHFPWNVRNALTLCYKLRSLAFVLGDRRSLGSLDMVIGSLNLNRHATAKALFYQGVLQRGIAVIRSLGDADILQQSQNIFCFYHFIEGEFAKALNCVYASLYLPEGQRGESFIPSLYCHASLSAVYMGEFDVALNILTMAIKRATKAGCPSDSRNLRGFVAYVQLLQHNDEEALAAIDEILNTHHVSVLTYAELWAARTLAYYHYLQGNILQSYICFKSWQERTSIGGVTHDNYLAAPFVLDMLAAYYLAGFAPPLQHTLEEELKHAKNSPSRLLRATALRISGEVLARETGWGSKGVSQYLGDSLELLRTLSAPLDTAKTLMSLARVHLARGNDVGARVFAAEAWSVHCRYGQPPWSEDLNILVEQDSVVPTAAGLPPARFCINLFQAMRQQYNWESNEDFFHSLICALLATFGMTKGCLYRLDDSWLLASVGMAGSEPLMEHMIKERLDSRRAIFRRLEAIAENAQDETSMAVLLSIDAEDQGSYGVWLSGVPRRQVEMSLSDELFTVLAEFIGAEICVHLRRSAAWNDHVRSVASSTMPRMGEASPILFRTACMRTLVEKVDHIAGKDATVLILGESGVGKELVARRLHELSGRKGEFVAVNLASTPDELFESEFYGHEKGSFTGASYQKRGLFELADKGTLFIDEVGDIPPRLQVKLLRVLQEKSFLRVGGTRLLSSEFRLIVATNRNLEEEVRAGRFREDLYYRLSVVPLHVPPLRERVEDILFLGENFLQFFSGRHQIPVLPFTDIERSMMQSYSWPGNVRELKNYVERRTLMPEQSLLRVRNGTDSPLSSIAQLSLLASGTPTPPVSPVMPSPGVEPLFQNFPSLEELQNAYFEHVFLHKEGMVGGKHGVAATLGISRSTAYAWIEKLGLKERFARRLVERKAMSNPAARRTDAAKGFCATIASTHSPYESA